MQVNLSVNMRFIWMLCIHSAANSRNFTILSMATAIHLILVGQKMARYEFLQDQEGDMVR